MGAGRGAETCKICDKPGHNACDCLRFMQREGPCGHWFMHSIGIYETGCTYGASCKKKHERPSIEPPGNDVVADAGRNQAAAGYMKPVSRMSTGAKQVSIMATGATPKDDGGEYVLEELPASVINRGISTWCQTRQITGYKTTRSGCSQKRKTKRCAKTVMKGTHNSHRAVTGASTHC